MRLEICFVSSFFYLSLPLLFVWFSILLPLLLVSFSILHASCCALCWILNSEEDNRGRHIISIRKDHFAWNSFKHTYSEQSGIRLSIHTRNSLQEQVVNELQLGCSHCLMPLSDTITLQTSLRTGVLVKCLCPLSLGRNLANFVRIKSNKLPSRWKSGFQLSRRGASKSKHLIMFGSVVNKTVAEISPVENVLPVLQDENINIDSGVQSGLDRPSADDTEEMPSKEDERRLRISHANKGKVPWNKGRKHSPETIARIRERTKQAMRDPKIRKKLLRIRHPQSEDTRMKIGIAVSKAYAERRKREKLQDIYVLEWEENIAEAARIGANGEDELQWDSYAILKEKMYQDWLQAVEMEKAMGKQKCKGERAPKSVEQKKKKSEFVRAKWADAVGESLHS